MLVNYDRLPEHMRESARAYIETGRPVGDFLTAVFENDFIHATLRADVTNRAMLREWAQFLVNECPPESYGSKQLVKAWRERGGMDSKAAMPEWVCFLHVDAARAGGIRRGLFIAINACETNCNCVDGHATCCLACAVKRDVVKAMDGSEIRMDVDERMEFEVDCDSDQERLELEHQTKED